MNFVVAFLGGILTFFSPCIFPLIPVYMTYLMGASLKKREKALKISLLFILGFSLAFSLMGMLSVEIGTFLKKHKNFFNIFAGILLMLFGIHLLGLRLKFLNLEKKLDLSKFNFSHSFLPFIFGFTFAVGWTPCMGPILASILILSSQSETYIEGAFMLLLYSLGIGIPFLIFSVFLKNLKLHRFTVFAEKISGILVVLLSILFLSGKMENLRFGFNTVKIEDKLKILKPKKYGDKKNEGTKEEYLKYLAKIGEKEVKRVIDFIFSSYPVNKINPDFKKSTVFINFWSPWCPPCVAEIRDFVAAVSAGKISVIGIAYEGDLKEIKEFLNKEFLNGVSVNYPIFLGDNKNFDFISSLPQTIILKNGKPCGIVEGIMDAEEIDFYSKNNC